VLFNQIENYSVGGQIAFVGDFLTNGFVFEFVKISVVVIENGIVPQPEWLMYLKIKAY